VKTLSFQNGLARNTAWMMGGLGVRLVIQALYFIEIARSLGASNYGAFVGVVALVGIAYPFGALGSGNLLIKSVARDRRHFPERWGAVLATIAACSTLLVGVVVMASHWALPDSIPTRLVLLVAGADLIGLNIVNSSGQAFQAFERLNWTAAMNAMLSGARLAGAMVLISIHSHPSALQWGYLYFSASMAAALAAMVFVCLRLGAPRFIRPRSFAEVWEGFYFSAGLSAQSIYNDIDKTMLARLSSLGAAGIYGAAYRLIEVSFVPIAALLCSAYPRFFREGARGVSASFAYAKPLLLRTLAYSVSVCLLMIAAAGLVPHIIGPEYAESAEALRWLAPLPVLKGLHYFLSDSLTGAGYQPVRTLVQACVAVFNVVVNLWVIPAYSWRGAAWSSLASDALLACAMAAAVFLLARRSRAGIPDAVAGLECG